MIDAATDEDAASRVESAIARGAHPILLVDARDAAEGRAPAADRAADVGGSVVAVARSRRDARTKTKTQRFATVASPATSEEMHAALCDAMTRAARRTASDASVAEEANPRKANAARGARTRPRGGRRAFIYTKRERISAERERISAERERISAERERISAERERISAERERISAEGFSAGVFVVGEVRAQAGRVGRSGRSRGGR